MVVTITHSLTGTSLLPPESYSNSNTEMAQKHSSTDTVSPTRLNGTVHTEGNQLEIFFFSPDPPPKLYFIKTIKPTHLSPEQSRALKMNQ